MRLTELLTDFAESVQDAFTVLTAHYLLMASIDDYERGAENLEILVCIIELLVAEHAGALTPHDWHALNRAYTGAFTCAYRVFVHFYPGQLHVIQLRGEAAWASVPIDWTAAAEDHDHSQPNPQTDAEIKG